MKRLLNFILVLLYLFLYSNIANARSTPYLILISMDGLRYDQTSKDNMPFLDSIGNTGVRALSLRPVFPSQTFPNHISIMTGLYPQNHGIIANSFIDTYTGEQYSLSKPDKVTDSKWYLGEFFWENAKRNSIRTASYFWPGSELTLDNRRPDYFMTYKHDLPFQVRIDSVVGWLKLTYDKRPNFITLYLHEPDSKSHRFGYNSDSVQAVLNVLDSMLNRLYLGIESIGLKDSIDIIVLSDHGMADVSIEKTIDIEKILADKNCLIQNYGTHAMIDPKDEDFQEIYNLLFYNQNNYKCFNKTNMPLHYHYNSHPYISPIILIAETGWLLTEGSKTDSYLNRLKGAHGFDHNELDMHGFFIANGPSFKNYYKTGTLWNIDIYPLLCKIFNIDARSNIDGSIDRIGFILKGE